MYEIHHLDLVYTTQAMPFRLAALGVLCCLMAAIWAVVGTGRGPKVWTWLLLLSPVAAVVLGAVALFPVFLAAEHGKELMNAGADGPLPWWWFKGLMATELSAWVAAVAILWLGVTVRCMLGGELRPRRWLPPGGLAVMGLLLALFGPWHTGALLAEGPMPTLDEFTSARIHVGHSQDLTPTISGVADPTRCETRPLVLTPKAPGSFVQRQRARCGPVRVERVVQVQVGEDRGDPGFPLAPGHRWSWRHVREWRNQLLWFVPDRGRSEGPQVHLQVMGTEELGPITAWRLRHWSEGGESREHLVYGWNGDLMMVTDDQPSAQPFFTLHAAPPGDESTPTYVTDHAGCTLGIFPNTDCRCLTSSEGEATLPGPSLCQPRADNDDDLGKLGSVLLAMATAGLVVVDPDQDSRWVLVGSGLVDAPLDPASP